MEKSKNKERSIIAEIKDVIISIIREAKDTPYALVSSLVSFTLIFFILFGSPICSLSKTGSEYCWLGIEFIILCMLIFSFLITTLTVKRMNKK